MRKVMMMSIPYSRGHEKFVVFSRRLRSCSAWPFLPARPRSLNFLYNTTVQRKAGLIAGVMQDRVEAARPPHFDEVGQFAI